MGEVGQRLQGDVVGSEQIVSVGATTNSGKRLQNDLLSTNGKVRVRFEAHPKRTSSAAARCAPEGMSPSLRSCRSMPSRATTMDLQGVDVGGSLD